MTSWTHLVDDAAVLPPAGVPLDVAVVAHREHLAAEYADLVGGLVVRDTDLADLRGLDAGPLALDVVVTGGAGAIEPAARWATGDGLSLRSLQITLRDEDDLARNAQRVVAMVDHCELPDGVATYVEVPHHSEHGWLAALDEVAMADLRLTFRDDDALPGGIDAALDRETPFRCVGGSVTRFLEATRAALATESWESVRRWLVSLAVPDVLEAHEELVEAGHA